MTTNAQCADLYQNLLEHPGDASTMLVYSDYLEEQGNLSLANAYRYAANNNLWPFRRTYRTKEKHGMPESFPGTPDAEGKVYDWDSKRKSTDLPETCKLPHEIYRGITRWDQRRYGGIHEAFMLLAYGLEHPFTNKESYETGNS